MINKNIIIALASLAMAANLNAEEKQVSRLHISQPMTVQAPIMVDTADVFGKAWDNQRLILDGTVNHNAWRTAPETENLLLSADGNDAIRVAGFTIDNLSFAKVDIKVQGVADHRIFIDGQSGGAKDLAPGRHEVAMKLFTKANTTDTLKVSVTSEQDIIIASAHKRPFSLDVLMNGERMGGVNISPDGRFIVQDKYITSTDAQTNWTKYLIDTQTGQRRVISNFRQWTSKGHTYITSHKAGDMATVYETVDALTGVTAPFYTDYSRENLFFLPGKKFAQFTKTTQGPKEDSQVFQVLMPDDRQPGWRDRNNVMLLNLATGQVREVTRGQHNTYGSVSPDGKKMLIDTYFEDITERPFSFHRAMILDLESGAIDTLFARDGFVADGQWSADGKMVIYKGSAEAFGGVGKVIAEDKIPSMYDYNLFSIDVATKEVTPLTANFNPSVGNKWVVSRYDGMIYGMFEDMDLQQIYRIDPKTGRAEKIKTTECYVMRFDIADEKPILTYYGQGASNSDRLYTINLKTGKETLIEDLNAVRMKDVELGEFGEWNFQAERGDTIHGRYYLPPHFDPSKKYPMLVYYYGGCSPVGRYLDSYYCYHGWASMGYVVYVIQPSGCCGFGQEFASRHVNTYGDYTADDIIQGTKKFCEEHPFVNKDKIGCLGASYGGFMTQYLQTQTDIFAAAMSHAGISDPSSYWGFGYWGYSYSAVSVANSYPWSRPDIFNDHAPLNLADRVHTPILFMHGSVDTNVPINESIQMFTALKILGRETAFVTVDGQNHHITDYQKRIKWQNTIYAWFEKWLKDDSTWWNTLYPEKNL